MEKLYPYYLGGEPAFGDATLDVNDKYTGELVCQVSLADDAAMDRAIELAFTSRDSMRALRPYERQAILQRCTKAFDERRDELADVLCVEAGKPIRDARGEVTRLIDTFRIAAEESTRIYGELIPMEVSERASGYRGMWKRVPAGACGFISPFNFPLNLVAHKVAPAIAAGCPFVLKPASLTPIGALLVGEVLANAGMPPGSFSILPCSRRTADVLVTDPRLNVLSFTGSPKIGWDMKARAGRKHVVLELGGNAAVIIDSDADLEDAVERITVGAFYQSGQSCISVQRIIAHTSVYKELRDRLIEKASALPDGSPKDEGTFVGPMISEKEAERVERWIEEAKERGATLLVGGTRVGSVLRPAILEHVPTDCALYSEEVFGPVAVLETFSDFDEALARVNDSEYGLQAGVFTRDIHRAHRAWDELEVGGVIIGDIPSWRVDHMPYGGVKRSGLGREGVRWAIEDMTEVRLMVVRDARE